MPPTYVSAPVPLVSLRPFTPSQRRSAGLAGAVQARLTSLYRLYDVGRRAVSNSYAIESRFGVRKRIRGERAMSVIPVDERPGARTDASAAELLAKVCAGARCIFCRSNEARGARNHTAPLQARRRSAAPVDAQRVPGAGRRQHVAAPLCADDATAINDQAAYPSAGRSAAAARHLPLVTGNEKMPNPSACAGYGRQIFAATRCPRSQRGDSLVFYRAQQERAVGGARGRGANRRRFSAQAVGVAVRKEKQRAGRMRDNVSRRTFRTRR